MTAQRLDGPQVIEIANDRIVGISAADDSARSLPDIRDLSRFTVLPGLVDSHTHLDFDVLVGLETQQASVDDAELAMRMVNRGIKSRAGGMVIYNARILARLGTSKNARQPRE